MAKRMILMLAVVATLLGGLGFVPYTPASDAISRFEDITKAGYVRLDLKPVEKFLVDGGTKLIKIWLEVGQDEQTRRFEARIEDPLRQWKLSPMDVESFDRWYDYSRARDLMLEMTDSKHAPWFIVRSDDKRKARLNCISHILSEIPAKKVTRPEVKLPKRSNKRKYDDQSTLKGKNFVSERY